jgi:acetolactate synthase-1/2/3 large subunit
MNLITGVANANMDHAPLVAIAGQSDSNLHHKKSHQLYDLISIFKPVTKWDGTIKTRNVVSEIVRKAFAVAAEEKPGAAFIELPEDIAAIDVEDEPLNPLTPTYPIASKNTLEEAKALINQYDYPLILIGNGVTRQQAGDELREFAEQLQCPVVNTFMGKGVLPWSHPQSLFTAGLSDQDFVSCGFDHADLIITAGYDIEEYAPASWNPGGEKPILHIDTIIPETDKEYPVKLSITGDLKKNLSLLAKEIDSVKEMDPYFSKLREQIIQEFSQYNEDSSFPMKPQRIIHDLRSVLDDHDILLSDVGAHKLWIGRMYPTYEPNTCLISNGLASMGVALPGAIAAKLLLPERKVIAVCGDGSFQMTIQELETAVRLKLPVVVLVLRDDRYGLIEWHQQKNFDRTSHITFGNPDLVQLAKAYGAKGYRVDSADQLKSILEQSFEAEGPVIIDCPVDEKENIKLTEELAKKTVCSVQ